MKTIRIAVGKDNSGWHDKFISFLRQVNDPGYQLSVESINMEANDWWKQLQPFDALIWKPSYMGPLAAAHLKEKIYLAEYYLKKIVVPNYHTVWTFESKIAQSYILKHSGIPIPETIASGDYHDALALIDKQKFPLVYKESFGAGSSNVALINNIKQAKKILERIFCHQLFAEAKNKYKSVLRTIGKSIYHRWFWYKVFKSFTEKERFKYSYFQEYIPNNKSDLRVTVIGDCYAVGFWRKNRPNDFRASGSGLIDYTTAVPVKIVEYCMSINKRLNFDSMAYDILIRGESFVIVEMSYAYVDKAVFESNGYYQLTANGLEDIQKKTWPQELWSQWLLLRIKKGNE